MVNLIDFIIHIDKYLTLIIDSYGYLTYLILFLIIFLETGIVVTPFLPGDSLIFVIGTIAAQGTLNAYFLFLILSMAAILGDAANYWIGNYFGDKVEKSRFFRKDYMQKTKDFYKKHGGKTIIFARFLPIIRTFAPFVAGIGKMDYLRFTGFNVVGGILWVALFLFGGYYFGGIPFVEDNLTIVILIIILMSFIPPIYEYIRERKKNIVN